MNSALPIAATILSGGKAERLGGKLKGLIEIGSGQTIIDGLIAGFGNAGIENIAISANDKGPYARFGLDTVEDIHLGVGPLGGIEAALLRFESDYEAVLFMPCDLPEITVVEITRLVDARIGVAPPLRPEHEAAGKASR